jgi:salicylate hydroxylase
MSRGHILLVGAGIGGLTAALSLQRHGFRVSLFERAQELRAFGAGLVLTPNAMHALHGLGVGDAISAASVASSGHAYRHFRTGELLRAWPTNRGYQTRYGADVLYVHRADLHDALSTAVRANDPDCIHLDHAFTALTQDALGVTARFANGSVAGGDALIGCDGVRSAVREKLHQCGPARFTGQVAYRALVLAADLPEKVGALSRSMYLARGRLFLHYPLRHNALVNIVAIARQSDWVEEDWAIAAEVTELSDLYRDFHPAVLSMVHAIQPGTLHKWGLCDRAPLRDWSIGRASMLGDAAHPMSPFLGQGAAMAIEDGMILGRCFANAPSPPQALQCYEVLRKDRTTRMQLMSIERGNALQSIYVEGFDRKRAAGEAALFHELFDYDPSKIPLAASAERVACTRAS